MSKARDLANAGTALTTVSATELGYLDGVTSAVQTQIDSKEATLPSQTGNSGKYLTTDGSAKSWGTVSQPTNWTTSLAGVNGTFYTMAFANNLYIAAGTGGILWTSPDAVTWTSRTSQFGADTIRRVKYISHLSLWIAVGDAGKISTSSDGATWTSRTANMSTNRIWDIATNGTYVIIVGAGGGSTNTGGIAYSTDGTTWTRKSQTPTVGTTYYTAIHNGTNFLVGAGLSTNNFLYASDPTSTWTAANVGGSYNVFAIIWDGTRHTIFLSSAQVYSATSTTLASAIQLEDIIGEGNLSSISDNAAALINLYNNQIYVGTSWLYNFNPTPSTNGGNASQGILRYEPGPGVYPRVDIYYTSYLVTSTGNRLVSRSGIIFKSF